jgi:hypothetical protein
MLIILLVAKLLIAIPEYKTGNKDGEEINQGTEKINIRHSSVGYLNGRKIMIKPL